MTTEAMNPRRPSGRERVIALHMTAATASLPRPMATDPRPLALGHTEGPSQPEARSADAEELFSLIGDIYHAALEASLWAGVLRRARQMIGGVAAAVFVRDTATGGLDACYDDGGLDPHYRRLYVEAYAGLDPFATGRFPAAIGEPVSAAALLPYGEFLKTRFYKEWARPQGLIDFMCAVLDRQATRAAMFGVFRHERDGLADAETHRRMRLIVPHIRRAVAIGRVIECKNAEAAVFADVLDGLAAGLFLVDAAGRIVHANASGRTLLDARSVLRTSAGKLIADEAGAALALGELFARVGANTAPAARGVAVALSARDGDHYVAHVLPLASGTRRCDGRGSAAAAVFVHRAALRAAFPPEAVARLYGLTPGELRVLTAIVEVGGVPETAEALGIAEATVKTHLHRLFAKTGAARQADLVKLAAALATPIIRSKPLGRRPAPQSAAAKQLGASRHSSEEGRTSGI